MFNGITIIQVNKKLGYHNADKLYDTRYYCEMLLHVICYAQITINIWHSVTLQLYTLFSYTL